MFCEPERSSVEGPPALAVGDRDRDGLLDAEEDALARRFAPIVILHPEDRYRPASIDWLLARADVFDEGPRAILAGSAELPRGDSGRSLPAAVHRGSDDPADWTTYVHVYPRADGGINLQYWFYYPYSDGPLFFDHDSDWEHATVELDAERRPVGVHLAQHENDHPGTFHRWSETRREGEHVVVLSARGTHATYAHADDIPWFERVADCRDLNRCDAPIWRTWEGGGIQNLGERANPLTMNRALAFRARWGSAGIVPGTSAPRGPLHHRGFCIDGVRSCLDEVAYPTDLLRVGSSRLPFGNKGMLNNSANPTASHIAP